MTDEQKIKISTTLKKGYSEGKIVPVKYWTGRKMSDEIKQKMSDAHKGKKAWNTGLTKETDPRIEKLATCGFFGKKHSKEWRKHLSLCYSGDNNPMRKISPERMVERNRKMGDTLKRLYRSGELEHPWRKLRLNRPTSIERLLLAEFERRDIPIQREVRLLGTPDIQVEGTNLLVFADGDHWHNYPDGTAYDHEITLELSDRGFTVFRFWGREIRQDPSGCVDKVVEVMNS